MSKYVGNISFNIPSDCREKMLKMLGEYFLAVLCIV